MGDGLGAGVEGAREDHVVARLELREAVGVQDAASSPALRSRVRNAWASARFRTDETWAVQAVRPAGQSSAPAPVVGVVGVVGVDPVLPVTGGTPEVVVPKPVVEGGISGTVEPPVVGKPPVVSAGRVPNPVSVGSGAPGVLVVTGPFPDPPSPPSATA